MSRKLKRWTSVGANRVERELRYCGLLIIQGQDKVASIADLLSGRPITTRGFSWDYVPAWDYCDFRLKSNDVEMVKLFRGKRTLVHRHLWTHVDALARQARHIVLNQLAGSHHSIFLKMVEDRPGIAGEKLKEQAMRRLKISESQFRKIRADLEKRLCVHALQRTDVEFHTHDLSWYPWSSSRIAEWSRQKGRKKASVEQAIVELGRRLQTPNISAIRRMFPVAKIIFEHKDISLS